VNIKSLTIIIVAIILGISLGFSISCSILQPQIDNLQSSNVELQNSLESIPFIQIGKNFLDDIGYTTGKVLFVNLENKTSNFYWHDLAKLEKPDIQGFRLVWIIRFEQKHRIGHFFEIWLDAETSQVMGGGQCR